MQKLPQQQPSASPPALDSVDFFLDLVSLRGLSCTSTAPSSSGLGCVAVDFFLFLPASSTSLAGAPSAVAPSLLRLRSLLLPTACWSVAWLAVWLDFCLAGSRALRPWLSEGLSSSFSFWMGSPLPRFSSLVLGCGSGSKRKHAAGC